VHATGIQTYLVAGQPALFPGARITPFKTLQFAPHNEKTEAYNIAGNSLMLKPSSAIIAVFAASIYVCGNFSSLYAASEEPAPEFLELPRIWRLISVPQILDLYWK